MEMMGGGEGEVCSEMLGDFGEWTSEIQEKILKSNEYGNVCDVKLLHTKLTRMTTTQFDWSR